MAFEFYYCVSLSILHPRIDPALISKRITTLQPKIEAREGSETHLIDGKPIVRKTKAALSHWSADLHSEKKLYSGSRPISAFLSECVARLEEYRSLFSELRQQGEVKLVIGWFSESNHSAEMLSAETLKKCGDLGLSLELDYYAPELVY